MAYLKGITSGFTANALFTYEGYKGQRLQTPQHKAFARALPNGWAALVKCLKSGRSTEAPQQEGPVCPSHSCVLQPLAKSRTWITGPWAYRRTEWILTFSAFKLSLVFTVEVLIKDCFHYELNKKRGAGRWSEDWGGGREPVLSLEQKAVYTQC